MGSSPLTYGIISMIICIFLPFLITMGLEQISNNLNT